MSNTSTIQLLGKRILVKAREGRDREQGGIFLPGDVMTDHIECDVIVVGDKVNKRLKGPKVLVAGQLDTSKPIIRQGSIIVISKHAGREIELNGEKFLLTELQHVIAILHEAKKEVVQTPSPVVP